VERADFVIVGSSGGGGTIGWLLARAGYRVVILEAGSDWAKPLDTEGLRFNPTSHDEYRYRLNRPELKRHPRGDYNTFRRTADGQATPFNGAWTGTMLGGGSVIWGAWTFRALPVDFTLATLFANTGQLKQLQDWGYAVPDWPVTYSQMEPFYNVAETLLSCCGDRDEVNSSVLNSGWYKALKNVKGFAQPGWQVPFDFPSGKFPLTSVGYAVEKGFEAADWSSVRLPSGMVQPGSDGYPTAKKLAYTLGQWKDRADFWKSDKLWSDRIRDACNMCGYCGEYLCWGRTGPKSGARASTLKELGDMKNAEVITDARAYEIVYDERTRRATGVRYLDTRNPDTPVPRLQKGTFVIVACGAVQSARLLLLSGPPAGLGNRFDQVGRYAMFHLFGLGLTCTLPYEFQGTLHGELGHTGNTMTFEHYFFNDQPNAPEKGKWWKGGTMVSTAKKNPLDNATSNIVDKGVHGMDLIRGMEVHTRSYELRLTGDDLPRASNRVDLDPHFVDEYGFPVARITRDFGPAEQQMFRLSEPLMRKVFEPFTRLGATSTPPPEKVAAIVTLIGDHQMGTCRMGNDPSQSVVDQYCRLHEVPNVFVVDTSFMPTGLGLNPMVTTVANALRVGTWIVQEGMRGTDLESDTLPV
jgi:choline dehydrogenase-like flavoprotein